MITGNKGEWSEIYVFLKLLFDGRIYSADKYLEKLETYLEVMEIQRQENGEDEISYFPGQVIRVISDRNTLLEIDRVELEQIIVELFNRITQETGTFAIENVEDFLFGIFITRLKAPSGNKTDIKLRVREFVTSIVSTVGFSIKSKLGGLPTLLNASHATNFIYIIEPPYNHTSIEVREEDEGHRIIEILSYLTESGSRIVFEKMESIIFAENLTLIDTNMKFILAEMIYIYYTTSRTKSNEILEELIRRNPLNMPERFYVQKYKDFLYAIALGLQPTRKWSGEDQATGGYIIVKEDGDILAFHLYNRNEFKQYLLESTKFDTPSRSRHGFGVVYEENGNRKIKLNFQIRFK